MSAAPQPELLKAYRKLLEEHPATAEAHHAALDAALRGRPQAPTRRRPRKYGIEDLWGVLLIHVVAGVPDRPWQPAAREYYRRKGESEIVAESQAKALLTAWRRGTITPKWIGERWVYIDAAGREYPVGCGVAGRARG